MHGRRATEILADYIAGEQFDRLPEDVIQRAKDCLQDAVACILAAQALPVATIIRDFVNERGGRPESQLLGTEIRSACTTAAFANATLQNALDYDDIYRKGHLGATAIAASFGTRMIMLRW